MSRRIVPQTNNPDNEGWPENFTMTSGQDQVQFASQRRVVIAQIPRVFRPVDGNTGRAPVYDYAGAVGATWNIAATPNPRLPPDSNGFATPSDDTSLSITGGG